MAPYAIRLSIAAVADGTDTIWGLKALQCDLSLLASHFQLREIFKNFQIK